MVLSEFELKRAEKDLQRFLDKRRPAVHTRDNLDLAYRIVGQSVELFEIRPRWDNPTEKMEQSFAKAIYVKSQNKWKVYWQRADLKWHAYPPSPEVDTLAAFLDLVDRDEHACFFG